MKDLLPKSAYALSIGIFVFGLVGTSLTGTQPASAAQGQEDVDDPDEDDDEEA